MSTFAKYPQYRLSLPQPIIPPKGYPVDPKHIGEHIRKRRLDLGLLQLEVAKMIGVTESTVWNWEHGTEPELKHIPKIIEFLGYAPFECPQDPVGRLRYFKLVNGLSYERLGQLMGRDPEQLTDWLSGRVKPGNRNIQSIKNFLAES
ncbi:MAG: helix-turn-helix transcriptional regulator [Nitrospirota bacterium]